MARWLVVHPGPDWSVHDMHVGWVEALQGLGQSVCEFNMNERLRFYSMALLETGNTDRLGNPEVRQAFCYEEAVNMAAQGILALAYTWWPDVVLVISGFFTPPYVLDSLRHRGHKVVILHSECPYQDEKLLPQAEHASLNLLNDPATLPAYEALAPAVYMPHAYREKIHHPGAPLAELKSDFCFAGTGWPSRMKFLEDMNLDGLDVLLAGAWPGIDKSPLRKYLANEPSTAADNDQVAHIYRASKAGINFYRREGDAGMTPGVACGPREIEQAACRLFFLRDPRPESDELFPMLPTFSDAGDASDKLRWWLDHDSQREKAAEQAREAVADRTFENNARRLLGLLESL